MTTSSKAPEEVYAIFSHTPYGKLLNRVARYNRFRPTNYPLKYWARLLGPDVNDLRHMHQTIQLARWFIMNENKAVPASFKRRDALLLGVTAALHDQGEAITGDIPHGKKALRQEKRELSELRAHERAFEPGLKGMRLGLYRYGRDKIAFASPRRRLAGAFEVIEFLGFAQNALHALRRAEQLRQPLSRKKAAFFGISHDADRTHLINGLERLYTEVLSSGIFGQLIAYGDRFPSTHVFLQRHAEQITNCMNSVNVRTFDWYDHDAHAGPQEKAHRLQAFSAQKALWDAWVQTVKP